MPRRRKLVSIRKPKLRVTSKGAKLTNPSARIGGKAGLNISGKGVSASLRTKQGTISTRTGLTRRRSRKRGCGLALLAFAMSGIFLVLATLACGTSEPAEPEVVTVIVTEQVEITRQVTVEVTREVVVVVTATPTDTPRGPTPTPTATRTPRPTSTPRSTNTPIPPPTDTPIPGPQGETAIVTQIIDGDTIEVNMGGTAYRVRYIGINTPESDEVCGGDATNANAALVAGQTVTMVRDVSETDQYGRLLRYVYVGNLFVNERLVVGGWAEAVAYPPDTRYASYFEGLESQAAAAGLGCHPTGVFTEAPPPAAEPQPPPAEPPPPAAVCDCSGNLYNCDHFSTHSAAQACFNYCNSIGRGDIHRLDGDNDGSACESLP